MANMAAANIKPNPIGILVVVVVSFCMVMYVFGIPKWFRSEEMIDMKELLAVSIDLAKRGGVQVKGIHERKEGLKEKVKGETDEGVKEMLTDGDMESHKAMIHGFNKAFPGLRVQSEEKETKPYNFKSIDDPLKRNSDVNKVMESSQLIPIKEVAVWIDPLDATKEYTEDLLQYVTTMVCVAVRGQPTMGVIHNPFSGETVWGHANYGHSSNIDDNVAKKTKEAGESSKKRIIVSRSHAGEVEKIAKNALGEDVEIIPAGGAGYKTLQVIKGNADAYVHVTKIKKWDICAGNAIILSVQGKMTTLKGLGIDYSLDGHVVNEQGILATIVDHDNYLKALKPAFEEKNEKQKHDKAL